MNAEKEPETCLSGEGLLEGMPYGLKRIDEDEYSLGKWRVIRNWEWGWIWRRNCHGWLVYRGDKYFDWSISLRAAAELMKTH